MNAPYCDGCRRSNAKGLMQVQLRWANGSWCPWGPYYWCAICRKDHPAAWRMASQPKVRT